MDDESQLDRIFALCESAEVYAEGAPRDRPARARRALQARDGLRALRERPRPRERPRDVRLVVDRRRRRLVVGGEEHLRLNRVMCSSPDELYSEP